MRNSLLLILRSLQLYIFFFFMSGRLQKVRPCHFVQGLKARDMQVNDTGVYLHEHFSPVSGNQP